MSWSNLPEETLVAVLQQLPLEDLLTFRAVSSALKRLVDSSLLLQYRIALGTHGLADNPACTLSSVRKLGELRSVTRSWHDLDFARLRDRRRAERARKRALSRTGVVGREDKEAAISKGKGKGKARHEKEFSTKIPVHNFAAVYDLAGGCFFQDLNRDWPFRSGLDSPGPATPTDGAPDAQEPYLEAAATETAADLSNNARAQAHARSSTLAWLALPSRRTLGLTLDEVDAGEHFTSSGAGGPSLRPGTAAPPPPPPDPTPVYTPAWYTAAFDFKVSDLCVDVERDLLIVFERADVLDNFKMTANLYVEHEWNVQTTLHLLSLSKSSTRQATSPLFLSSSSSSSSTSTSTSTSSTSSTAPNPNSSPTAGIARHAHPSAARPTLHAHAHVRSHTHGRSHLLRARAASAQPAGSRVDYAMTAHLAGDFVGVLLSSCTRPGVPGYGALGLAYGAGDGAGSTTAATEGPDTKDTNASDWFWLFDWVRGTCLVRMESAGREQWDTFCFVGAHALMIPDALGATSGPGTGSGALNVYFFDDKRSDTGVSSGPEAETASASGAMDMVDNDDYNGGDHDNYEDEEKDENESIAEGTKDKEKEKENEKEQAKAKARPSPFRHVLTLLLPETVHPHAISQILCHSQPPPCGRGRDEGVPRRSSSLGLERKKGDAAQGDAAQRKKQEEEEKEQKEKLPPPPPFSADPDEAVIILNIDYLVRARRPNIRRVPVPIPVPAPALEQGAQPQFAPFHQDYGAGGGMAGGAGANGGGAVDDDDGLWIPALQGAEHEDEHEHEHEHELQLEDGALVVDGYQISIAHPQVVALRRKDVMRWARAAEEASRSHSSPHAPHSPHFPHPNPHPHPHPHPPATQLSASAWVRRSRWGLSAPPARWVCCAHGARFASMEDRPLGSALRVGVRVYDFGARTIARAQRGLGDGFAESDEDDFDFTDADEDNDNGDDVPPPYPIKRTLTHTAPTRVHLPEIFRAPFLSALPYRLVETEAVFDWDSCLLDDERVIGLVEEEEDEGALMMLEVLVL